MKNKLVVSPSPHIHSGDTIEKNMYGVLIALVPAFIVSLYVFGFDAFILTLKQSGAVGNTVPAKLQEYMSGNKPIFSAAGKGATEIIENADCGKAVPPSDYKALSQALADFIDNPEKYKNCGRNGLKYFNKNYTLDIFETRLLKIIRENLLEDTSN